MFVIHPVKDKLYFLDGEKKKNGVLQANACFSVPAPEQDSGIVTDTKGLAKKIKDNLPSRVQEVGLVLPYEQVRFGTSVLDTADDNLARMKILSGIPADKRLVEFLRKTTSQTGTIYSYACTIKQTITDWQEVLKELPLVTIESEATCLHRMFQDIAQNNTYFFANIYGRGQLSANWGDSLTSFSCYSFDDVDTAKLGYEYFRGLYKIEESGDAPKISSVCLFATDGLPDIGIAIIKPTKSRLLLGDVPPEYYAASGCVLAPWEV